MVLTINFTLETFSSILVEKLEELSETLSLVVELEEVLFSTLEDETLSWHDANRNPIDKKLKINFFFIIFLQKFLIYYTI